MPQPVVHGRYIYGFAGPREQGRSEGYIGYIGRVSNQWSVSEWSFGRTQPRSSIDSNSLDVDDSRPGGTYLSLDLGVRPAHWLGDDIQMRDSR